MTPARADDIEVQLPDDVVALFDGADLDARVGYTIQLLTVDADASPRVALLSVGEVLSLDRARIRMALWPQSRSTANLTRTNQGALAFVHDGIAFTIRLRTCRAPDLLEADGLAVFDGYVDEVRSDESSYAILESGITFSLPDRSRVVERWKATVAALRAHEGCEAKTETASSPPIVHDRSTGSSAVVR